jgi:DNA-binding LacI/PurR family transcriptional regulator
MSVTLHDIAKIAKTSHATVSRALNDNPRISLTTRKNIKKIAKKLGYNPSVVARALRSGRTFNIGLVVPDLKNPFYVEFLRGVEAKIQLTNYQLIVVENCQNVEQEKANLEKLISLDCDGIISTVSFMDPVKEVVQACWDSKRPFFARGLPQDIGDVKVDGCNIIMRNGIEKAVSHLVQLGHKNIVFIASWPVEVQGGGRIGALKQAFENHGLEFGSKNIIRRFSGNQIQDGYYATLELIKNNSDITAIICTNDIVANGVMHALSEMGLKAPHDISVIGTDDTWLAKYWPIPLTSITMQVEKTAEIAVKVILDRLSSDIWDEPKHISIDTDLIIRQSTGPVRS